MNSMFNQIMLNIKRGYYKYIGSGSSRDVFDLGNGYVIKVAKIEPGLRKISLSIIFHIMIIQVYLQKL